MTFDSLTNLNLHHVENGWSWSEGDEYKLICTFKKNKILYISNMVIRHET